MTKKKRDWQSIIAFGIFVFFLGYWLIFQLLLSGSEANHHQIYTFSTLYGVMALWGALCGILISRRWGGFKSILGKGIFLLSLGIFAQEFGQLAYSYYYIILHLKSADYPGLGDLGFFATIPLYSIGILYLGKASGVALRLKSLRHVLPAIAITFSMLILSYILFLQNYTFDWSNPVKVFLDFGYPLGDAIYVSLAISVYILSKGVLGGIMRGKIVFIIFALAVQFLADYTFLIQTANGTWVDSGVNDLIYLFSYFFMAIGLIQFGSVLDKIRKGTT